MHEEHGFRWLAQIPALSHYPNHVVMAVIVAVLLFVTTTIARMQLSSAMSGPGGGLIPAAKLTYRGFFEVLAEKLYGITESVLGHHAAPTYFPLIGTLFVFIFTSNFVGLIPGVLPATEDVNTTFAVGAFVFLYYNYVGLKTSGLAYLKHFLGPVWWLAWLILPIELFSHLFRPVTLGIRLRANIFADHQVLGAFSSLVEWGVPIIFMGFGLFVSLLQAFVFCVLTMVYISLATAHDH